MGEKREHTFNNKVKLKKKQKNTHPIAMNSKQNQSRLLSIQITLDCASGALLFNMVPVLGPGFSSNLGLEEFAEFSSINKNQVIAVPHCIGLQYANL